MTTVFFSGSRSISHLNQQIKQRIIENIMARQFTVVIGDANGADKAFQQLFAQHAYQNVQIFCSGTSFRNNLGNWQTHFVPSNQKGRAFYTEKDKKMAQIADYGFVLWDGKSQGSLNNIRELLGQNKFSLVYHAPSQQFMPIKSQQALDDLIGANGQQEIMPQMSLI